MSFKCERCGACCKRYWITVLPGEIKKQAKLLKISKKEFIERYTILYLQLFPTQYKENTLEVFNEIVPKKIALRIERHLGYLPEYFLILPILAFKRNGCCIFFDKKDKACKIYNARPKQCELFPFISLDEEPNFLLLYPFCKGLKLNPAGKNAGKEHYRQIVNYFDSVRKKGFSKLWKRTPKEGIALFRDNKVCNIGREEFFQCIAPFR